MRFWKFLLSPMAVTLSITSSAVLAAPGKTLRKTPSYQAVIQAFQKVYGPLVEEEAGVILDVRIDEENPDYFGGASLEGQKLTIGLGNNLPQQQGVTEKAIAFALCHEVGHLLGGLPKKMTSEGEISWASTEGQSDYYAAKTCLPMLFEVPTLFEANKEKAIVKSGLDFILSVYELIRFSGLPKPSVTTPDESKVGATLSQYPSLQCRLDTVVAGAADKARPSCWFAESAFQKE
jgi:hypothetical protein